MAMWKLFSVFAVLLCCSSVSHGFSYSKGTFFPCTHTGISQYRHSMLLRVSYGAVRQDRNKCSNTGRFSMMAVAADIPSTPVATSAAAASSAASVSSSAAVAVPAGTVAGAADSAAPVANTGTVAAADVFSQVIST